MNIKQHASPAAPHAVGGFTLIEVLAALVIVSVGMMAVIDAVSQTASTNVYLREKTLAHWVAMNRLTEARLQPAAPKVDRTSDEVEMAGRRWRWTMDVTQTPVESIRRIDVSVRPVESPETSSMARVTGFYGAAIAPPGSGAAQLSWQGQPSAPERGDDTDEPKRDDDDDADLDTEVDELGNPIVPDRLTDPSLD